MLRPHRWAADALRFSLFSILLLSSAAHAVVRLPAIVSDHAVLQRASLVPIWGWAAPQEEVSVQFGSQSQKTRAGQDGRWKVQLDLSEALPSPATLTVRGDSNEITVNDVLVGDVWLASGQSNMEKPIGERRGQKPTLNAAAEIAAADYPNIRLFKVGRKKAGQPLDDVSGAWVRCSPETVDGVKFSAAAYFFGQRLHKELNIPVGLIDSTWGGTRIEPWTPAPATASAAAADPTTAQLFNGMIAGLAPAPIKGVIWYQGESNIGDPEEGATYSDKMARLVLGWRRHWQSDFPFYYVQLAPHLYHLIRRAGVIDPHMAAQMWEAQADALRISGTGMIVTTDLADDLLDIHPRDKKSVGVRLANLALARTYQRSDIAADGPVFHSMQVEADRALLRFDHAVGLAARDGKPLSWFEIAGADGRYYAATAIIKDNTVVVTSAKVAQPVAVRFGWDEAAQPNLVNQAGLPAMPFRTQRPAANASEAFDLAITVDDLPAHGKLPQGMTRLGIAESHLKTLNGEHVPEAFGFVNAVRIVSEPGSEAVLDAWRKAGYPLGNHTFSHMNLESAPSLEAWEADVAAGEPAVAARMANADWRYLRFPYLDAGTARRSGALAYLHERGYRIADVSLSFNDWAYTDAYARCVATGDTGAIAAMKSQYLAGVDDEIASMKVNSKRVYGRIISQVLLTHVGGWSAVTLPEVLARLKAAGAHYVTLAQAQADPAYAVPGGGSVIIRTAKENGISLAAARPARAPLDLKAICQ